MKNRMDYSAYVDKWTEGLYAEIKFWENYISTEGVSFSYERYLNQIDSEKAFQLEELLPENIDVKFIDVGSGPFSRCGRITNKCNLEITCIDPLGNIYEVIKKKYGIDNKNKITRGFVELLDKQFAANSYDIVHMSNSLDHCFDPIYGIYQLINICKIGGKVVLRHHENEAERSEYCGLHQWNLSLHNKENSFVIWNSEERIDVCKEFSEYVEFKITPDIVENGGIWTYNQVEMIKRRDVTVPKRDYLPKLLFGVFDSFLSLNYELVKNGLGDRIELKRKYAITKINNGDYDKDIIKSKRNVIWGNGEVGKALLERVKILNAEYVVIDKKNIKDDSDDKFIDLKKFHSVDDDVIWITFKCDGEVESIKDKMIHKLID